MRIAEFADKLGFINNFLINRRLFHKCKNIPYFIAVEQKAPGLK